MDKDEWAVGQLERAISYLHAEFRNDIADLKSTLRLHTWILSSNTAGILILLGLALQGH
jgi:hypothetical protein